MKYKIPFNKPFMVGKELHYIEQSVQGGHTAGDGQFSRKCQQLMENKFHAKQVLLATSCTAALELSAILCDINEGDEVILPSYTFVSTANAFLLRGAKLVFIDIRPDTLNIDEEQLEAVITERTKAIIVVHYAGVACEMDRVMEIARKHSVYVIEDAAQGVNAKYKGTYLGTIGDVGCYSFHETKNFICGEGGALVTNNTSFVGRAEIVSEKGTNRKQFFRGQVDKYTWVDVGSSYLPSDILAAFLFAQLEMMDEITTTRENNYHLYYTLLTPLAEKGLITLPSIPPECESNYHMFYILMQDNDTRMKLIEHLKTKDILAVFHYVPLHSSPMGVKFGHADTRLPVTDNMSERVLRMPFYNELEEGQIRTVVEEVFSFFGQ